MYTPTKEINIMLFEEALNKALTEETRNEKYDHGKWLYIPDYDLEYRYILGTVGENPLIAVGINPSTARPNELDNTLRSVSNIALSNGFDSYTMFNVYAQRATLPEDMDENLNKKLHDENMKAFRWALEQSGKGPVIWAAWGAVIEKRSYLKSCLKDMIGIGKEYQARWYTAGSLSKKGHPHHPLYLKKDSKLDEFNIEAYLKIL